MNEVDRRAIQLERSAACMVRLRRKRGVPPRKYREVRRNDEGLLEYLCSSCGHFKIEQDFSPENFRPSGNRGLASSCKECERKRKRHATP